MKKQFILWSICFAVFGCIGNSESSSKLELNVESVNFCERPAETTTIWNNLQLRNSGKGAMTISSIRIRGDESCAFTCTYPNPDGSASLVDCPNEAAPAPHPPFKLDAGSTLLVRIGYTPAAANEGDSAALIIETDASNLLEVDEKTAVTEIAVCGFGVPANVSSNGDAGSADGGLYFDAGEGECPACPGVPEKGAPACADRK